MLMLVHDRTKLVYKRVVVRTKQEVIVCVCECWLVGFAALSGNVIDSECERARTSAYANTTRCAFYARSRHGATPKSARAIAGRLRSPLIHHRHCIRNAVRPMGVGKSTGTSHATQRREHRHTQNTPQSGNTHTTNKKTLAATSSSASA